MHSEVREEAEGGAASARDEDEGDGDGAEEGGQ